MIFRMMPVRIAWNFSIPVFALGITSIVTQVVVLREFLSAFYGNELVIGVVLATWMALTGLGSFLGKYSSSYTSRETFLIVLLAGMTVLPLSTIIALRIFKAEVFPFGTIVGLTQIFSSALILLLPYCLLSGFLFTMLARLISQEKDSNLIRIVYAVESAGSVIGGLLFNCILVFFLSAFEILAIVMVINGLVVVALLTKRGNAALAGTAAAGVILLILGVVIFDVDGYTGQRSFRGQELLYRRDTPYGNLTVTKQGDQTNFYENTALLYSTNDIVGAEESVHYAMVQHREPRNVLVVSGGTAAVMKEILKYDVEHIDYVEFNPWIAEIGRRYDAAQHDDRVRLIGGDARLFLKGTARQYDVALVNVPDPTTAQLNRYYTIEFFRELKRVLSPNGIVSMSLVSSADYLSDESRRVRSILRNTLMAAFAHVLILPGGRDYFLASDGEVDGKISRRIRERGVVTTYVNAHYIDDELMSQRRTSLTKSLNDRSPLNEDFFPVAYYSQITYWLSEFSAPPWLLIVVSALLVIFAAGMMNTIAFGVFASGFAASSLEIVVLLAFQVIYGYVYYLLGVIITVFMAGLACGALFLDLFKKKAGMGSFVTMQLLIAASALLLPSFFSLVKGHSEHLLLVPAAFVVVMFSLGFVIGAVFGVGSGLARDSISTIASHLYSIDLVGSALGALLVSSYFVPILGITKVCFIVAGMSLVSSLLSFVQRGSVDGWSLSFDRKGG